MKAANGLLILGFGILLLYLGVSGNFDRISEAWQVLKKRADAA